MVLKLYGMAKSTCTLRVAIVLKEKDVPFEFIAIDFKSGEHKSQSYLEKQPFGQVPYIVSTIRFFCITHYRLRVRSAGRRWVHSF